MNIAFMGGLFPKEIESEIIRNSKGMIDFAANNLQWGIIKGLDTCSKTSVFLCNVMFINSYPIGYKKMFIKTQNFSHKPGSIDNNLGFFNLIGFNMICRFFAALKGLLKWSQDINDRKVIITYGLNSPFLLASTIVKTFHSNIKVCLVVPDLPEFMSESKSFLYRVLKSIDRILINHFIKKVDAFVLLCETMVERLNINQRPWILMEGIYQSPVIGNFDNPKHRKRAILYTGTLKKQYGIQNLLTAFESIKYEDIELWICGEGEMKNEVIKRMASDPRIKYYGQLPRNKILAMQQEVSVLINPRTSSGKFTRYSFPSKIMEYLASGTPTIIHYLPGIPEEYYKYCFVAEDQSSESLKMTIISTINADPMKLEEIGKSAKEFILEQKSPEKQVMKIIRLIEAIT